MSVHWQRGQTWQGWYKFNKRSPKAQCEFSERFRVFELGVAVRLGRQPHTSKCWPSRTARPEERKVNSENAEAFLLYKGPHIL